MMRICGKKKGCKPLPWGATHTSHIFSPIFPRILVFFINFFTFLWSCHEKIKNLTTLPPNFPIKKQDPPPKWVYTHSGTFVGVKSSPSLLLGISRKWIVDVIGWLSSRIDRFKPQPGSEFFFFFLFLWVNVCVWPCSGVVKWKRIAIVNVCVQWSEIAIRVIFLYEKNFSISNFFFFFCFSESITTIPPPP